MIDGMSVIFMAIILTGAFATVFSQDPFDKLISLGILIGGVMPFFAYRGLLDILAATALVAPLSTIFILMAMRRRQVRES
jgi:energy-converting hydrogenase A subunit D